jgi:aromatic-L-amino-acid decarboxylase
VEPLRQRIRDHVAWAEEFAGWVRSDPRFELAGLPALALVCFRLRAGNEATRDLLSRVNASGRAFLSQAEVAGGLALRLAVGGAQTRRDDVETAWKQLAELA